MTEEPRIFTDEPPRLAQNPLIRKTVQATPAIERTPGGLYFQVGGEAPVCMFSYGCDMITVDLSQSDAEIIGKELLRLSKL